VLATQTLVRSPRRLWLGADHPLLTRPAVSLRNIAVEPYIMATVDEAEATTLRYWRRSRLVPAVAFRTSSLEAVREMVAAGLGVTILADIVHRPWSLEGNRIEVRDVIEPVPSLDVGIAWKPARELSPAAEAFRRFLVLTSRNFPSTLQFEL
jgi:DNA-binding transcriptional LysR family regulator